MLLTARSRVRGGQTFPERRFRPFANRSIAKQIDPSELSSYASAFVDLKRGTAMSVVRSPRSESVVRRSAVPTADGAPRHERVLFVDDHEGFLYSTTKLLESSGFRVLPALTGAEALRHGGLARVDVLLTDLRLPDMSGLELVEKFRGQGQFAPVIMLTAYPELSAARAAAKLNIEFYAKDELAGDALGRALRAAVKTESLDVSDQALKRDLDRIASDLERFSDHSVVLLTAQRKLIHVLTSSTVLVPVFLAAVEALALVNGGVPARLLPASLRHVAHQLPDRVLRARKSGFLHWSSTSGEFAEALSRQGLNARMVGRALRFREALLALANSREQVAPIAYQLGYDRHDSFDRQFHKTIGLSPSAFRKLAVRSRV